MNREEEFKLILADLNNQDCRISFSKKLAISLIDLTLLDENATDDSLAVFEEKAAANPVAAICVYPMHLAKIHTLPSCKRATVANFPNGNQSINQLDIETLFNNYRPDELDYVFPYKSYLGGDKERALAHCREIFKLCQQHAITFKVILETGAFPSSDIIYQLSREIIDNGCDFLKTSTGKIPGGVTPIAAFTLLKAISDSGSNCGIKVSGGIKTPAQAFFYMELGQHVLNKELNNSWFRIGASSLLDELVKPGNNTHPDY